MFAYIRECFKNKFGKKTRKYISMKNAKKTGRSAKRGNAPAPYTKYHKRPYQYLFKRKFYGHNENTENKYKKAA